MIGAFAGTAIGAGVGYATTGTLEGMATGAAVGFGAGSVVGAAVGGTLGSASYTPPKSFSSYPSQQFKVDPHSLKSQRNVLSKSKYRKNLLETMWKHGRIDKKIIVNRQGYIIDGHHRVEVAKTLQQTVDIIIN